MSTYLLQITKNGKDVQGYIYEENGEQVIDKNGFVLLDRNNFNPLTILGDIKYISKTLPFEDNNKICIAEDSLFQAPYEKEKCFDIEFYVRNNKQYFYLVDAIKKIIISNKKISVLDLHKLANYLEIPIHYDLSFAKKNKSIQTDMEQVQPYFSYKYGLNKFEEAYNQDYHENHLFTCSCSNITEIVFYIFFYLILFNYHFFQCQHCKKYSAIKRSKGTKTYCCRTCLLPLEEYKELCCEIAVPKLLDTIRTKKKRIYDNNNHLGKTESNDKFLNEYYQLNDLFKKNRSAENLLALYEFVNKSSKHKRKNNS